MSLRKNVKLENTRALFIAPVNSKIFFVTISIFDAIKNNILSKSDCSNQISFPASVCTKNESPFEHPFIVTCCNVPTVSRHFPSYMLNSVNPLNDKKFSTENLISIKPPPIYIICDFFTFSNATKKFITTFWVLVAVNNLRLKFHKKSLTTRFWQDGQKHTYFLWRSACAL